MLSNALRAAAQEAEELEKRQLEQETRLMICEDRVTMLEEENRKLRGVLSKAKESLYAIVLSLDELEN